ncbi:phosphotransferase [uncultured Winogradskyella sp.]|uniref:phosphotransferase n=1 Tax=uncultured Winogradskyella sp. TaxID=395353 RepID=UPI00261F4828|nr:phosphotransferase [uncultured Winogradskyella sp.]
MNIPIVPGRGLVTNTATNLRLDFLKNNNVNTDIIENSHLELHSIRNNIESYIGSTEIPLGIVGPLIFKDGDKQELTYCSAGTLEGALIASMNRGSRVISKSGGFSAKVKWQKMTRSPMFIFNSEKEAMCFKGFIKKMFSEIKIVAESFSNHAKLLSIDAVKLNHVVHLKFAYKSSDASGQNMTTTCTWHAMLFIIEEFKKEANIAPLDFVIEGNGASDKKVSQYNINSGRGIHVVAKCRIPENILNKVLRTTSGKMITCFKASKRLAKKDGMVGYNINVANTIAAIFVATGQDLASIHESGVGFLSLKKKDGSLCVKLTLPNLVIGTIGGGTSLPKQKQALEIMNCYGNGKVNRFAKLIAGFALGLELSTFAAIVSGEFAKAHEKLGRNKPTNWLLPSEINLDFIKLSLNGFFSDKDIQTIEIVKNASIENGILTNIASKVNRKVTGFIPLKIEYNHNANVIKEKDIIIKSKPLDIDVIKGLHTVAASINPELSDLLKCSKQHLEYRKCHLKELEVYDFLHKSNFKYHPFLYGKHIDANREIYMLMIDVLNKDNMQIMNSENNPEAWNPSQIISVIQSITQFHKTAKSEYFKHIKEFKPWKSKNLYKKLMHILITECSSKNNQAVLKKMYNQIDSLEEEAKSLSIDKTIIHNDFNTRNIAIRNNSLPVIYDWELAVIDFPHRDIIEFLSFVLPLNFEKETFYFYLKEHFQLYQSSNWTIWLKAYKYALNVFIITRLSFYEVSGILIPYDFSKRVLNTALIMLNYLEEDV